MSCNGCTVLCVWVVWEGVQGWTYAFGACKSNFLDCYFLDHSPCTKITHNLNDRRNSKVVQFNRSRLVMPEVAGLEMRPAWWAPLVGQPRSDVPERSIRDLDQEGSVPSRMVFYSYFFRPNYSLRRAVHQRVQDFGLAAGAGGGALTALHVRRGDVLLHQGQARFYIPLHTYLLAARPFLQALGVTTVLLLTDSQAVVDEALACAAEHPELCAGLAWRFVDKPRWRAAEGGWENPFPSGSAVEEFMHVQLELALAQQCDMMIMGNSGYGDMVYNHMCCGFPLHTRGSVPQRCLCPPKVRVEQGGFTCEKGNKALCKAPGGGRRGGRGHRNEDPAVSLGANFSRTQGAFVPDRDVKVWLTSDDREKPYQLSAVGDRAVQAFLAEEAAEARRQACMQFREGPDRSHGRIKC